MSGIVRIRSADLELPRSVAFRSVVRAFNADNDAGAAAKRQNGMRVDLLRIRMWEPRPA